MDHARELEAPALLSSPLISVALMALGCHYTDVRGGKARAFLGIVVVEKATAPGHCFQFFLAPEPRLEQGHQLLCQAKLFLRI